MSTKKPKNGLARLLKLSKKSSKPPLVPNQASRTPQLADRVVACCHKCKLINVSERQRLMCPYCGAFYDPNDEKLVVKPRIHRVESSDDPKAKGRISSSSDYHSSDSDDEYRGRKRERVKKFLKGFVGLSKRSSSNSNLNTGVDKQPVTTLAPQPTIQPAPQRISVPEEPIHRFFSPKNKNTEFFSDYRATVAKTAEEFKELYDRAIETNEFKQIEDFYSWYFSNSTNLNELLVTERLPTRKSTVVTQTTQHPDHEQRKSDPCYYMTVNWKFMREIYSSLEKMPSDVVTTIQQAICFCISSDLKPMIADLRAIIQKNNGKLVKKIEPDKPQGDVAQTRKYLSEIIHSLIIFVCNPLLDRSEHNLMCAIVLHEIASLHSQIQSSFVYSLRRMPLNIYREVLKRAQYFLVDRLFPDPKMNLVKIPLDWTLAAVRFISILHFTNELQIKFYQNHFNEFTSDALADYVEKQKYYEKLKDETDDFIRPELNLVSSASNMSSLYVSYQEFYVKQLDRLDLYKEFCEWQLLGRRVDSGVFSYCHYPFIISIDAKRKILERDSEQQMMEIAKKSFIQNARGRSDLQILQTDLYVTLKVKRKYIMTDSLNEIELKKNELKKKLKITFVGEQAVDMGGVRKEWFLLVVRQIFTPVYGMFTYNKEANCNWFAGTSASKEMLAEYHLIGVLMGLAVYNGEILDLRFPPIVYKKLAVQMDTSSLSTSQTVGCCSSLTLYDLRHVMPSLASSLNHLLEYDGDVKEEFMLKFEVSYHEADDSVKTVPLKRNGQNIDLTNENRKEYVELYIDFLLNKQIYEQFKAFYLGFHSICSSNAMLLFRPEEIESLVCGSTEPLDLGDLKMITLYDKYIEEDNVIKWFWDILENDFDSSQRKKLLLFATGSDRIPISGVKDMSFKISRIGAQHKLPMAHTCFNQLILPHYSSREVLKAKLLIAIENAEGFGFK